MITLLAPIAKLDVFSVIIIYTKVTHATKTAFFIFKVALLLRLTEVRPYCLTFGLVKPTVCRSGN